MAAIDVAAAVEACVDTCIDACVDADKACVEDADVADGVTDVDGGDAALHLSEELHHEAR